MVPCPVPKAGLNTTLLAHLSPRGMPSPSAHPNISSSTPLMGVLEPLPQPTTLGLNRRGAFGVQGFG